MSQVDIRNISIQSILWRCCINIKPGGIMGHDSQSTEKGFGKFFVVKLNFPSVCIHAIILLQRIWHGLRNFSHESGRLNAPKYRKCADVMQSAITLLLRVCFSFRRLYHTTVKNYLLPNKINVLFWTAWYLLQVGWTIQTYYIGSKNSFPTKFFMKNTKWV